MPDFLTPSTVHRISSSHRHVLHALHTLHGVAPGHALHMERGPEAQATLVTAPRCTWQTQSPALLCTQRTQMPTHARVVFVFKAFIPSLKKEGVTVNTNKCVITVDCATHSEAEECMRWVESGMSVCLAQDKVGG